MKLKENRYTTQAGEERVTYQIGKLNEFGEGITVDTKIEFMLDFPPRITPVTFKDTDNTMKTFQSVNILAQCSHQFENVVLSQYSSANYSLPEKYAEWIKGCQKCDKITVWLRSFEAKDGKKKSTWDCNINDVNVKKGSQIQKAIEDTEVVKEVVANKIAPAVQQAFNAKVNNTIVDHTLPAEKKPQLPTELTEWATQFDNIKEAFQESFCNDGHYPTTFVGWMLDQASCGTNYVVAQKTPEEQRAKAVVIYEALCHRLGL
jgi:hypothetical protein